MRHGSMRVLLLLLLAACSAGGGNQVANGGGPSAPPTGRDCASGGDEETCDALSPAERMRGVWVTGFERSGFIPDATEAPARDDVRAQRIWLTFARGAAPNRSVWAERDSRGGQAFFAIEFVGRRTQGTGLGGGYGHLNGAETLVVVDRILSMRVIGPPVIEGRVPPPAEGKPE